MAHYAFLDENNVVVKIITGVDENETQIDLDGTIVGGSTGAWEKFYENQPWHSGLTCKRTSYNGNIRKQFAGVGYTYNSDDDVFIAPKPFPSWRHAGNYDWEPPVPYPENTEGQWFWDESEQKWVR